MSFALKTLSERIIMLVKQKKSGVHFAKAAGLGEGTLRGAIRNGNPTAGTLYSIAKAGNVSLDWLITGTGQMRAGRDGLPDELPLNGFARSGITGWFNKVEGDEFIPRPLWCEDSQAFFARAAGQSMLPAGIRSGDFCLISPQTPPKEGNNVWVKDNNAHVAIKKLDRIEDETIILHGWLDRQKASQQLYQDERKMEFIDEIYPVVEVYQSAPRGESRDLRIKTLPPLTAGGDEADFVNIKRINAQLSAGGGAWNESVHIIDHIPFTREFLRKIGRTDTDNLTILEATGDSMEPTIGDGDLVLIDELIEGHQGDGIYAIVFDDLAMVKRLRRKSLSTIEIASDNATLYPPFEVDSPDQLQIIGKAIWRGHLFG